MVKMTVSLPADLKTKSTDAGINFSQTLQFALKRKLYLLEMGNAPEDELRKELLDLEYKKQELLGRLETSRNKLHEAVRKKKGVLKERDRLDRILRKMHPRMILPEPKNWE